MTLKRNLFARCSDLIISLVGLNRPIRVYRAFLSRVNAVGSVQVNGATIRFDANDELHLLRGRYMERKEPDTLAWIDTFSEGDVFYDIGANIGVFSLYAALRRHCDVYAFEPEAKNYACLNKNIYLNGLGRRIKALNVGLHDRTGMSALNLRDLASGSATHALGEPLDWRGRTFVPKFEQTVLAFALDELVEQFGLPIPHHVKLDVDGNEERIIHGGVRTLSNPSVRSLIVEMNDDAALGRSIESCGLRLAQKTLVAKVEGQDIFNALFVRP